MASSDVASHDFVLSVLTQVWQAVGMEILIFSLTLLFAGVLRGTGTVQTVRVRKNCKLPPDEDEASDVASEPAPGPAPPAPSPPVPAAHTSAPTAVLPGNRPRRTQQLDTTPRQLGRYVDDIISGVKSHPCAKTAAWAMEYYLEFRSELKRTGITIAEVGRTTRWTGLDMYSTLVSCAVRGGHGHMIPGVIDDMVQQGMPRPISLYESAMKQLAGQKLYHLALAVYDQMAADGLKPSTVTCSCLINFAAEAGELDRAVDFFGKLQALTTPSIRAYMTILRVHCRRQDWPASLETLQDMEKRGIRMDSLTLNVALATCVAAEQLEAAEQLLARGHEANPPVSDVVSYNTLIKGYAARADPDGAQKFLERMRSRGLKPNAITMNTAMDAAVRGGRPDDAWALLATMRAGGLSPDKFTCSILIKGLRKSIRDDQCHAALDLLQEVGVACDASLRSSLYHALLEAAAAVPDQVLVNQVASRMRQQGVPLNEGGQRRMREVTATTG